MHPLLKAILGANRVRTNRGLDGFDNLLQTFENCRAGLSDETIAQGEKAVLDFFLDLYEKEAPRFRETLHLQDPTLRESERRELWDKVDQLVRKVVVPAYARLAGPFTKRERNDFYLAPEPYHALERVGWGVGGVALGAFVVWAPFIPLWAKEWMLVFGLGGLVFPNVRRVLAYRRYERELNQLVAKADDEIWRTDIQFLTRRTTPEEPSAHRPLGEGPQRSIHDESLEAGEQESHRKKPKLLEGGR